MSSDTLEVPVRNIEEQPILPNGHSAAINGIETPVEKPPEPPVARGTLCKVKIVDQVYDSEKRKWIELENAPNKTDKDAYIGHVFVVLRKMNRYDDSDDEDLEAREWDDLEELD